LQNTQDDDLKIPISDKLKMTIEQKEELQHEYQSQLLMYNIMILSAYYVEIPNFIAQKKRKYRLIMARVSQRLLDNYQELANYWLFLSNFYKC
jgi:hypothetical protein